MSHLHFYNDADQISFKRSLLSKQKPVSRSGSWLPVSSRHAWLCTCCTGADIHSSIPTPSNRQGAEARQTRIPEAGKPGSNLFRLNWIRRIRRFRRPRKRYRRFRNRKRSSPLLIKIFLAGERNCLPAETSWIKNFSVWTARKKNWMKLQKIS